MADPIMIDVFKFLAVRPAQRVTENETQQTTIRDARAADANAVNQLERLARGLAVPGQAQARWQELALGELIPLADAYRLLIRRYEELDLNGKAPDAKAALTEAGIQSITQKPDGIFPLAFDALYIAERTGADAGLRLETPMAALRVLHFARLGGKETPLTRDTALTLLRATPIIPLVMRSFLDAPGFATPLAGSSTRPNAEQMAGSLVRSAQLQELATALTTTERLLSVAKEAPAMLQAPVLSARSIDSGGTSRTDFTVGNVSALSAVLPNQLPASQVALLDQLQLKKTTSIPAAVQVLQAHLTSLNSTAFTLADDPEFQGLMREQSLNSNGFTNLVPVKGALDKATKAVVIDPTNDNAPDVDVSGRITPLGIGDLKVVKQTLLAYVPGEVAYIENVLKGETKERKHRNLDRTETTLFTSEEETKDTERDTQSTDRFELKRETEQTIKEDMSIKAGLNVTASYGPVVAVVTGDFAYSTSKQDSQKSSSNFAREVVDRSVSKLQTKKRTERTTKTLSEVEEINTHGVDNVKGSEHVVGIYRWVDKRYRAQVYNYGVRMLLEFIVPEPAAFYRMAQSHRATKVNAKPPLPFESAPGVPLVLTDIKEANYTMYAGWYNTAGITPPPPFAVYATTSFSKEGDLGKPIGMVSDKFVVPEGYTLWFYSAAVALIWQNYPQFTLSVGGDQHQIIETPDNTIANMKSEVVGSAVGSVGLSGSIPVSVAGYDVASFSVNIQGLCVVTQEATKKWQSQTYDKIYSAYQALQTTYDQKVAQAESTQAFTIQGQNPAMNRIVEKTELKKLCITMMTGQHYDQFNAMTDPMDAPKTYPEIDLFEALTEGRIEQFFEQAFEWEQLTYLFYPYFWGRKKNWVNVTQLSDPDPLFAQFLTAGAARVVVPVPLAYVSAVTYLLQQPGTDLSKKVWRGGERPTIDDKDGLYVSITEELRNQTDDLQGAKPDGPSWEFTLPTTLVWLQPDGKLPSFI